MKKTSSTRILRIMAAIVIVLLLIIFSALFFLEQYTERIARSVLDKEYSKLELSHIYDIDFDKITLQILSGNVRIKNLQINPKESFFSEPDSLRLRYPILVEIVIPKLVMKGLNKNFTLQFEFLNIPFINAFQPEIRLIDHLTEAEKVRTQKIKQEKDTIVQIPKWKAIHAGQLLITDGVFEWTDLTKTRSFFKIGTINYSGSELQVVSENIIGSLLQMLMERSYIDLGSVQLFTADGFYEIAMGNLSKKAGDDTIAAGHFKLIPQYDKMQFGKKFGRQTDRFDIEVGSIDIVKPDVQKWFEDRTIAIHEITIDNPVLNIFRDKNIARDMTIFPKLPHQALAGIKSGVDIRKIKVINARLIYEELELNAAEPGRVPIKNMFATLYNVTNISSVIEEFGSMTWDTKSDFFDAANLEVSFAFPADIANPEFAFSGKMDNLEMTAFNVMITPNAGIRIDQGFLHSMDFNVVAHEDFATGEVRMHYEDMKLTILKKSNTEEQRLFGLVTFLANAVIRGHNPDKESNKEIESAHVFVERDKNKGVFNYMSKSLISGIQNTLVPGTGMTLEKYEKHRKTKGDTEK
jgi:hypothetical protein